MFDGIVVTNEEFFVTGIKMGCFIAYFCLVLPRIKHRCNKVVFTKIQYKSYAYMNVVLLFLGSDRR